MTEQTVNIPLLRKAVEWAEAEAMKPPELCEWNQFDVRVEPNEREIFGLEGKAPECGTCYCIAGYVVAITNPAAFDRGYGLCGDATAALGLPDGDSKGLFHMDNSIADVRRIAEEIAGERL